MPASSTRAGASSRYGRSLSRRQWRLCRPWRIWRTLLTGPLLDAGFLEHLVGFRARLLERVGGGQALVVDLVQRPRPDVTGPRALGLRRPDHLGRFEILGHGLEV